MWVFCEGRKAETRVIWLRTVNEGECKRDDRETTNGKRLPTQKKKTFRMSRE